MKRCGEIDIKAAFLQHLRELKVISKGDVVTSEYVLGANGRRADLAFWAANFVGVEVKSDADSLGRLGDQVAVYEHCFEKTVVVVAPKHVTSCLKLLAQHIGLWVVDGNGRARCIREAALNPARLVGPQLELLTVAELRHLVGADGALKSRKALVSLCGRLSATEIAGAVNRSFISKYRNVSDEFWLDVGRRKITCDNIEMLTRFAKTKVRLKEAKEAKESFWAKWQIEAAKSLCMQPSSQY